MVSDQVFRDRRQAGKLLARALSHYAGRKDVVVLGLPRGGVPVAAEVAGALGAPLDVLIVRKLGAPGQEELAIGAIAEGGVRVLNRGLVESLGLSGADIDELAEGEERELARRVRRYRGATVIVAAAPVGAADSVDALRDDADEVVVLETPAWFNAVGQWYENFGQTSDEEVRACLGVKEAA